MQEENLGRNNKVYWFNSKRRLKNSGNKGNKLRNRLIKEIMKLDLYQRKTKITKVVCMN